MKRTNIFNHSDGFSTLFAVVVLAAIFMIAAGITVYRERLKTARLATTPPAAEATVTTQPVQDPSVVSGNEQSGIKGEVLLGAATDCYSPDPNSTCNQPRHLKATIDIQTQETHTKPANPTGRIVATVTSGEDGKFSVNLSPGYYLVVPRPLEGYYTNGAQSITVHANEFAIVTVFYN